MYVVIYCFCFQVPYLISWCELRKLSFTDDHMETQSVHALFQGHKAGKKEELDLNPCCPVLDALLVEIPRCPLFKEESAICCCLSDLALS